MALVRRLQDDVDELVDLFLQRIRAIPPYDDDSVVPAETVRADALASFDHLLLRLTQTRVRSAAGIAEAVGRDRARRRVPLDALVSAVRLDFGVIWSRLRSYADADEDAEVLVAHVEHLLAVIEDYTARVQRGYLLEEAVMAREHEYAVAALLGELLDGSASPGLVQRVTRALDLDPDTRFVVAATPLDCKDGLWRAHRGALGQGRGSWWIERDGRALCFFAWGADDLGATAPLLGRVPCAIAPVAEGVAALPTAARVAARLSDVVHPDDGPGTVRDLWVRLVVDALDVVAAAFATDVLRGLADVTSGERERILRTAQTYLRVGSVQACADEEFCHRNTVLNRLRRLQTCTGLDITRPRDAGLLVAALAVPGVGQQPG